MHFQTNNLGLVFKHINLMQQYQTGTINLRYYIYNFSLLRRRTRLTRAAARIEPQTSGTQRTSRSTAHLAEVITITKHYSSSNSVRSNST